jgi:acetyl esterase/lipase
MQPLKSACLALLVMTTAFVAGAADKGAVPTAGGAAETASDQPKKSRPGYLTTGDTIGDILGHPAFAGFARRILPWDDRAYDESLRLSEIGRLLPYHSAVRPDVAIDALNRMIDEVNDGRTVFYELYGEAEQRAEPSKRQTGLFFLRGRPGAPFAVIAPGGGFSYVGSVHEGFPYALNINRHGYNAFVLKYRTGRGGAVATRDMAAAVSYIFANAETLAVGTGEYSVWGSSAGARMAAAIGSHGVAAFGGDTLPRPSTVVMAYTGHSDTAAPEPATFVAVGELDGIAPPAIMERRVAVLRQAGTRVEYRKFPNVGHGFGPGIGTSAEGWLDDAVRFWEKSMKGAN